MSRGIWLIVPIALALGVTGGIVVDRQVLLRQAEVREKARDQPKTELAKAEVPKPAEPELPPTVFPPTVPVGSNPFVLDAPPPPNPEKAATPEERRVPYANLPPGAFDLPAPHKNDGTDPPIIKPGQVLQVEVLETLPGRPITGDRVVLPDGTISLGFYGNLRVAGLNRDQIKLKLIEHMRQYINDEVLGLITVDDKGNSFTVPPMNTSRVLVDESANFYPGGPDQAPRQRISGGPDHAASNGRIDQLEEKLDRVLKELETLRAGPRPSEPPATPPAKPDEKPPG